MPFESTPVVEVVTREVELTHERKLSAEALRLMVGKHFRHLPIVDGERKVLRVHPIRNLLQRLGEDLQKCVNSHAPYQATCGFGV